MSSSSPAADRERVRALLRTRQAELLAESRASALDRAIVEVDQQSQGRLSRMDAIQQQELALEVERRRQAELHRIDGALERLAAGEYGVCTACGEPIAAKRLELDPAASLCIACAQKAASQHH